MKERMSLKNQIKAINSAVVKIDRLRSDLFVKMLPPLFVEHCAKIVRGPPYTWIVITEDKNYLMKVERVLLDYADTDPGRHMKFFDASDVELYPPPEDIIALINSMGNSEECKNLEKS